MKKETAFFCQWNEYAPQPDRLMTRARAALLLKAWRNNSRKNTNRPKWVFKRIKPHVYFVKCDTRDIESHTFYIGVKP